MFDSRRWAQQMARSGFDIRKTHICHRHNLLDFFLFGKKAFERSGIFNICERYHGSTSRNEINKRDS